MKEGKNKSHAIAIWTILRVALDRLVLRMALIKRKRSISDWELKHRSPKRLITFNGLQKGHQLMLMTLD